MRLHQWGAKKYKWPIRHVCVSDAEVPTLASNSYVRNYFSFLVWNIIFWILCYGMKHWGNQQQDEMRFFSEIHTHTNKFLNPAGLCSFSKHSSLPWVIFWTLDVNETLSLFFTRQRIRESSSTKWDKLA